MTSIGYTAPPFFAAQKGRKRLFGVPITVTVNGFNVGAQWFVRVSSLTVGGVFLIQAMTPAWAPVAPLPVGTTSSVKSPNFPPAFNGQVFSFTAFASFLDNISAQGAPTTNYNAAYRIEVFDTQNLVNPLVTAQFSLAGSADPARSASVVFALDYGNSMSNSTVTPNRLGRLQAAVARGVRLLRDDDFLGAASFASEGCPIDRVMLGPATRQQQDAVTALANRLVPDQSTAAHFIQTGINAGRSACTPAASPTPTLVLLTDGANFNRPALSQPTLPTSALIIAENSTPVPPSASKMVSSGTGVFLMALPQTLGEFAIEKLLTQILIGITGAGFVSDPEGSLEPGADQRFPVQISEADRELQVIVFSNDAAELDVSFEGVRSDEAPVIRGDGVLTTRLPLRPLQLADYDRPTVIVSRRTCTESYDEAPPVRFNLLVATKSDLVLDAEVTATGLAVGSELLFSAVLHEYGLTWEREGVTVQVELTHPDGFVQVIPLEPVPCTPGRFQASVRTYRVGAYTAHIVLVGCSLLRQLPVRRECLRTIAIFPPSDCCPADDPCAFNSYSRA